MEMIAPWHMNNKFVYTCRWTPKLDVKAESFKNLPVWVEFPFRLQILEADKIAIAETLGDVLHFIQGEEKSTHPHDKACILWDTDRPAPNNIKVEIEYDDELAIWQEVKFRNIPYHCYKCGTRGHSARDCEPKQVAKQPIASTSSKTPTATAVVPSPGAGSPQAGQEHEKSETPKKMPPVSHPLSAPSVEPLAQDVAPAQASPPLSFAAAVVVLFQNALAHLSLLPGLWIASRTHLLQNWKREKSIALRPNLWHSFLT